MKTLVIGGGGHIGNAITRALLERNYQVTATGRRPALPINLAGLPLTYVDGNTDKPDQFERWIEGHDLVIDAAAPYPLEPYSVASAPRIDPFFEAERRTRHLIKAISRRDAVLVYVGSFVTMARPRTNSHGFREQVIKLMHPYFRLKELIESQLCDAARRGVRVAILNPTTCYGPWDLRDRQLCTIPALLRREIPSAIIQKLNVVDVRDVAAAAMKAIDQGCYGTPLLIGGHDISVHDLYALICQIGGIPVPRLSTNTELTMMVTYGVELVFNAIGREAPLRSAGMMMATAFDYDLPPNALPALGIVPRALRTTLSDAIEWYRRIGYC